MEADGASSIAEVILVATWRLSLSDCLGLLTVVMRAQQVEEVMGAEMRQCVFIRTTVRD